MTEARPARAAGQADVVLPHFKGRPGWEFTDISGPDLAAYEPRPSSASAEAWEQFLSGDSELDGVFNVVTELIVGDATRLRYVCGQALSERSWIFGAQRAELGRDAALDWVAF